MSTSKVERDHILIKYASFYPFPPILLTSQQELTLLLLHMCSHFTRMWKIHSPVTTCILNVCAVVHRIDKYLILALTVQLVLLYYRYGFSQFSLLLWNDICLDSVRTLNICRRWVRIKGHLRWCDVTKLVTSLESRAEGEACQRQNRIPSGAYIIWGEEHSTS